MKDKDDAILLRDQVLVIVVVRFKLLFMPAPAGLDSNLISPLPFRQAEKNVNMPAAIKKKKFLVWIGFVD